jgi:hypothetical protein
MRTSLRITALALGIAGMVLAASQPAASAPVATNTAALKAAAPDATIDVRYRGYRYGYRHGWAGPAVAGLALGIIGAGIATATAPRYYYYDEPYDYGPRAYYYDEPYYYAPRAYYAQPYPYAYSYGYGPYWGAYARERFW